MDEARPERQVTADKLLAEMHSGGLIERTQDPHNKSAKPYLITDKGRDYLAASTENALFPLTGQRQDWSAGETTTAGLESIAAFIRTLPEFHDSGDARIQEVSQQLAQTISRSIFKSR